MALRLLLDTHVVVRWLVEPKRLSREQRRVLDDAVERGDRVAISAISLLEIAILSSAGDRRIRSGAAAIFDQIEMHPAFEIIPIGLAASREVAALGRGLADPADRLIVATARVHRLRLLTSDQRIVESGLAETID